MINDILATAAHFKLSARPTACTECTCGHINSTYFIDTEDGGRYVLQRINTGIFKDPAGLMSNIIGVTEHIRKKLRTEGADEERGTLRVIPTVSDEAFLTVGDSAWRMYTYVGNVDNLQSASSPEIFESVGRAFGHFQMQLADYDAASLCETIPDFHNTPSRYESFELALQRDAAGRASEISEEVAFVKAHKSICAYITDRIANGTLPLRVTHNDTKLNNILIDHDTGKPICVIDLDTVMPGSVLFDFGDAIRFGASSAAEDETDLGRVFMREEMFFAFARGFIDGLEGSLTDDEILSLPMGAVVITLETGIRFLTDYLNGDTYFRIHYSGQNLDRARNQFKLVRDMEEKLPLMNEFVKKLL